MLADARQLYSANMPDNCIQQREGAGFDWPLTLMGLTIPG